MTDYDELQNTTNLTQILKRKKKTYKRTNRNDVLKTVRCVPDEYGEMSD